METLQCTCSALRTATRAITLAYDNALRPSGLRLTQYSILKRVAALGRPLLSELAEILVLDRTTLGRNLRPLERDGLLRTEVGQDRRERLVSITPEGLAAMARARPLWQAVHDRMELKLGVETSAALRDSMRAVTLAGKELAAEAA